MEDVAHTLGQLLLLLIVGPVVGILVNVFSSSRV
jgi:hypothetical protein